MSPSKFSPPLSESVEHVVFLGVVVRQPPGVLEMRLR
jgi:hypothetical protein